MGLGMIHLWAWKFSRNVINRNQVLYYIQDNVTFDYYIGLTGAIIQR
jgi:hypothetical protein